MDSDISPHNFLYIDRSTAYDILKFHNTPDISVIDYEEGSEFIDPMRKVVYRKIIFNYEDKNWLLTAAMSDREFVFYLYAEGRWSENNFEKISCIEMISNGMIDPEEAK